MCLGIPMRVVEVDGYAARCEAKGIEREVSLFMLQDEMPAIGDFVMVHVGYAVETVSAAEARTAWAVFDELLGASGA